MRKTRVCSNLKTLEADIKAPRHALRLTRRALAEQLGIDPRYLANIENSGSLPSLPIFYELVRICKLPPERYFFVQQENQPSEQRRRVSQKLTLCSEEFLPVVEGALDGAIQVQENRIEQEE